MIFLIVWSAAGEVWQRFFEKLSFIQMTHTFAYFNRNPMFGISKGDDYKLQKIAKTNKSIVVKFL